MQRINIIGNVCGRPEMRTTASGRYVCTFTVAVNRPRRAGQDRSDADFFRVSAWEKQGEACANYLDKGSKVFVSGTISANAYTDKNGAPRASLELSAQEVEFLTRPTWSNDDRDAGYVPEEEEPLPY